MALDVRTWAGAEQYSQRGPALGGLPAKVPIWHIISQLVAGQIFGAVGPIAALQRLDGWRIDRQNAPQGFVNISVQKNDVKGKPSTVASVFVPAALNVAPPPGGVNDPVYHARMEELQRSTRIALQRSFDSYGGKPPEITRWEVWGNFSA